MSFALNSPALIVGANRLHIPGNPLSIRTLNVRSAERWLISIANARKCMRYNSGREIDLL